jgi:hypothetical protein
MIFQLTTFGLLLSFMMAVTWDVVPRSLMNVLTFREVPVASIVMVDTVSIYSAAIH